MVYLLVGTALFLGGLWLIHLTIVWNLRHELQLKEESIKREREKIDYYRTQMSLREQVLMELFPQCKSAIQFLSLDLQTKKSYHEVYEHDDCMRMINILKEQVKGN